VGAAAAAKVAAKGISSAAKRVKQFVDQKRKTADEVLAESIRAKKARILTENKRVSAHPSAGRRRIPAASESANADRAARR